MRACSALCVSENHDPFLLSEGICHISQNPKHYVCVLTLCLLLLVTNSRHSFLHFVFPFCAYVFVKKLETDKFSSSVRGKLKELRQHIPVAAIASNSGKFNIKPFLDAAKDATTSRAKSE